MADMAQRHLAAADEFYVGYLRTPPHHRRFIIRLMLAMLAFTGAASAVIVFSMRDPGGAVWQADHPRFWTGVLKTSPYPVLTVDSDQSDHPLTAYLLIEQGKQGAGPRATKFDGQRVTIQGVEMSRGDQRMIELMPGADAITPIEKTAHEAPHAKAVSLGRAILQGEIVDSKCFLGAMKPGDGKTHKSCATLCISNGSPPLLVTFDRAEQWRSYLLLDEDGSPANKIVTPFIAEPIMIQGEIEQQGEQTFLRITRGSIRRR